MVHPCSFQCLKHVASIYQFIKALKESRAAILDKTNRRNHGSLSTETIVFMGEHHIRKIPNFSAIAAAVGKPTSRGSLIIIESRL